MTQPRWDRTLGDRIIIDVAVRKLILWLLSCNIIRFYNLDQEKVINTLHSTPASTFHIHIVRHIVSTPAAASLSYLEDIYTHNNHRRRMDFLSPFIRSQRIVNLSMMTFVFFDCLLAGSLDPGGLPDLEREECFGQWVLKPPFPGQYRHTRYCSCKTFIDCQSFFFFFLIQNHFLCVL